MCCLLFVLSCASLLHAQDPAAVEKPEPFRLGVLGALSGSRAPYGLSQARGAGLAAEVINRDGGIGPARRPLELIAADDHGEPGDVGALCVDLIHRQRVIGILGSVDSGCTHVAAMVAVKSQVPHLTCVATDPSLTRAGTPWTFRTLADDERQGAALVEWLRSRGVRTIVLLAADSRYGKMGAASVARRAAAAGLTVDGPIILPGNGPLDLLVKKVQEKNPEAVVIWGLAGDGLRCVKALHGRFTGVICGGDGLASPAFFRDGGREVEGVVLTCPYVDDDPNPLNREFRRLYRERFGEEPDSFAAHAYDTVRLIAAALARSDGTREGLRGALAVGDSFPGVTGEIRFDDTGNDTRSVLLARCLNGRLELVSDKTSATPEVVR